LLLLAAEVQGRGVGRAAYTQLEAELRTAGCCRIRIDVVDEDADNVKPFWCKLGFVETGRVQLSWGNKTSSAAVMHKQLC
ncbi:MAG: GNAT family N-acetyltransferase, partial [Firmicutes bacterium]|nr:GNAT family N-acetyltransferase [Bacillota bacterium]